MEKKRRARINHCLNELKTLILEAMKKDVSVRIYFYSHACLQKIPCDDQPPFMCYFVILRARSRVIGDVAQKQQLPRLFAYLAHASDLVASKFIISPPTRFYICQRTDG